MRTVTRDDGQYNSVPQLAGFFTVLTTVPGIYSTGIKNFSAQRMPLIYRYRYYSR